jgi:hypothetical protein
MSHETFQYSLAVDTESQAVSATALESITRTAVSAALDMAKYLFTTSRVVEVNTTSFKNDGEPTSTITVTVIMGVRQ